MGFFSKLFGGDDLAELRAELEASYLPQFRTIGMEEGQARGTFRTLFENAKKRSKEQGSDRLGPAFGDSLLARVGNDEAATKVVERLKGEGVTEADIRWWWNLHDIERCIMVEFDQMSQLMLFSQVRAQGGTTEAAEAKVRKHFPVFGAGETNDTSDDRPLPFVLKDRINKYLEKPVNRGLMRAIAPLRSSMNAYIREQLHAGQL